MLFKKISEENGWMVIDYTTTWPYSYQFMLDAAQTLIDTDLKLQRVATGTIAGAEQVECFAEVQAAHNDLRKCEKTAKECGVLIVSGISETMGVPLQFVLYNQTNALRLFCPMKELFHEHGDHCFDNYMNSIEIKAYCKSTERQCLKKQI